MIKALILAIPSLLLLLGCQSSPKSRDLDFQVNWIRQTTKDGYLGYRFLHQAPPAVSEDIIIAANAIDGVVAFDKKKAQQLWRIDVDQGVDGGVLIHEDYAYFGGNDANYYKVNIYSGNIVWKTAVQQEVLGQSTIYQNTILFPTAGNALISMDTNTGRINWRYSRNDTGNISIRGASKVFTDGKKIYSGFSDGFFAAINFKDGSLAWERLLNTNVKFKDIDTSPVVDQNQIFVAGFDGSLYSLSLSDGQINWKIDEGAQQSVLLDADRLYVSSSNSKILSVDKNSGKILWTYKLESGIGSTPQNFGNFILVGTTELGLLVISKDKGQLAGSFQTGSSLYAQSLNYEGCNNLLISGTGNLHSLCIRWASFGERWPWKQ